MKRLDPGKHIGTSAIRVFLLVLALSGVDKAVAAGRLLGNDLRALNGVIAADLDGDRRADWATAGLSRRDSRGFLQEITVRLGPLESSTITVRTAVLAHRLSARDLDGDADRDLILESFDREPIAVLLNDGEGHFHAAKIDEFRARLHGRHSPSIESQVRTRLADMSPGPSNPTAGLRAGTYRHALRNIPLDFADAPGSLAALYFHTAGRGPPPGRD